MRYIPPGVTDVQLFGVSKATVHDPDPGYYRCCDSFVQWLHSKSPSKLSKWDTLFMALQPWLCRMQAPSGILRPCVCCCKGHCAATYVANNNPNQGNTNGDGIDMQANDTAEVLLERLGYKVFLGGMYSVEDYRAM